MDHFLLARGYTVSQTPSNLHGWEWKMPKKGLAQMKSLPNLLPNVPFQSVYHGSAQIYTLETQQCCTLETQRLETQQCCALENQQCCALENQQCCTLENQQCCTLETQRLENQQCCALENQQCCTLKNNPSTLFLVCVSANVLSKAECVELMHACTKLKHSIFLSTFALPIAVGKKFSLERLLLHEVLIPKLLNGDVPHYKLLTEQEIQQVEKHECTKRSKFPHMNYETDAIARYCGFLPGTVVFNKEKQEYRLVD